MVCHPANMLVCSSRKWPPEEAPLSHPRELQVLKHSPVREQLLGVGSLRLGDGRDLLVHVSCVAVIAPNWAATCFLRGDEPTDSALGACSGALPTYTVRDTDSPKERPVSGAYPARGFCAHHGWRSRVASRGRRLWRKAATKDSGCLLSACADRRA